MITRQAYLGAQKRAIEALRPSGLSFTDQELERIEVADFGLSDVNREGAQILTLVQTERLSVKVLFCFPNKRNLNIGILRLARIQERRKRFAYLPAPYICISPVRLLLNNVRYPKARSNSTLRGMG